MAGLTKERCVNMAQRMAQFEKVSYEQFKKDWIDTFYQRYNEFDEDILDTIIRNIYDSIKLPKRATGGSMGYDFFCPCNLMIPVDKFAKIPTGIKCYIEEGWGLGVYPRSGQGFKYGVHLANTVGIIDLDYYNNKNNEGHIFVKLVNDSELANLIDIKSGDAFCQGIFTPYGITYDDDVSETRVGGLGSTSK